MKQLLVPKWFFSIFIIVISSSACLGQTHSTETLKSYDYFHKKYGTSLNLKADSITNYYKNAIQKFSIQSKTLPRTNALINLAETYLLIKNYEACSPILAEADNLMNQSKIESNELRIRLNKCYSEYYYRIRNYHSAIKYCLHVINVLENKSDSDSNNLVTIYDRLSTSYIYTQQYIPGLLYINKSDSLLKMMSNPKTNFFLNNAWKKAIAQEKFGNHHEALRILLESLKHIDEIDYSYVVSLIYKDIADLYYRLSELDKSIQYYNQTIKVYEHLKHPKYPLFTRTYATMARVYTRMGKWNEAIKYIEEAIQYGIQNNDPQIMYNYTAIADVYMSIDSLEMADKYLKESIKVLKKHYPNKESEVYATTTFYYGHFLIERMHDPRGIEMTEKALRIYKKIFGKKHPSVADCYNYLGKAELLIHKNPDKALQYLQEALISNNTAFNNDNIYTNPNIKNTLNRKYMLTILTDKASALSQKINRESNAKENIVNIELMNRTLLLAIKTIDYINTSFTSVDSKLKMNERTESLYSTLISSTLDLYQITENKKYLLKAYEHAGNSKTAILNSLIEEDNAKITAGVPQDILEREKELKIKKGDLNNQLNNLEIAKSNDQIKKAEIVDELFITDQEIDLLTANLEKNHKKYHQLKYKNESLTVDQLQNQLSDDQVVLEYFLTGSLLINFIINKDSFTVESTEIDTSFFKHINRLSETFRGESYTYFDQSQFNAFKSSAHELYLKLIAPSEQYVNGKELIIIPDKELLQLPFEVLLTSEAKEEKNFRDLPYLIHDYPLSYSYSSEWLFNGQKKTRAKKGLLAIVPSYDKDVDYVNMIRIENERNVRDVLAPIPAALDEAKNIIQSIGGNILEADDATEAKFKKIVNDYSILHFAMHTVIDNKNPMFSKLVFTQSVTDSLDKEDNLLNTYEIFNMDLNAQMVVLSSCNSGYGTLQKGEGIMSMARGFIFAGCPSLAITLWAIDDIASADLMSSYYQYLAKGMNKARALQKAKIEFIKNADPIRVHPHFWASHILIGNTEEIKFKHQKKPIYFGLAFLVITVLWFLLKRKFNQQEKESLKPDHNKNHSSQ